MPPGSESPPCPQDRKSLWEPAAPVPTPLPPTQLSLHLCLYRWLPGRERQSRTRSPAWGWVHRGGRPPEFGEGDPGQVPLTRPRVPQPTSEGSQRNLPVFRSCLHTGQLGRGGAKVPGSWGPCGESPSLEPGPAEGHRRGGREASEEEEAAERQGGVGVAGRWQSWGLEGQEEGRKDSSRGLAQHGSPGAGTQQGSTVPPRGRSGMFDDIFGCQFGEGVPGHLASVRQRTPPPRELPAPNVVCAVMRNPVTKGAAACPLSLWPPPHPPPMAVT